MTLRASLVIIILCCATAAFGQTINLLELDFRDSQGKAFGVDDQFLVFVNNDIPHQKGLRARLFGGTKQQILRGAVRVTADACRVYDTNLYPIHEISGNINLGFIFDETWLAYHDGTVGSATYTMVVEQGDDSTSVVKIPSGDGLNTYFKYAYTFTIQPVQTTRPATPLPVSTKPDVVAKIANAETARELRVMTLQQIPKEKIDGDCTVLHVIKQPSTQHGTLLERGQRRLAWLFVHGALPSKKTSTSAEAQ